MHALKEKLISCSCRTELADVQTESHLWTSWIQQKLSQKLSPIKVRALTGKDRLLKVRMETCVKRLWRTGDIDLLNFDEPSLSVEASSPRSVEGAFLTLRGLTLHYLRKLWRPLEALILRENADSPQDPSNHFSLASRPITKLKFHQTPKSEVQGLTHEEFSYTPKELPKFSNLFRQKPRGHVWGWILMVWDNGKKYIKLS